MVENTDKNNRVKVEFRELSVYFGAVQPVRSISMCVFSNEILGIIGPSSSGKTSLLKTLNRMNELNDNFRMEGTVLIDGKSIFDTDAETLRKKVGMVYALPLPLPLSIFDNVAYGPRMSGIRDRKKLEEIVVQSLEDAALYDEVKDRMKESAFKLSGGQQQRLCIARSLALQPEVMLFDEPCSGLDPVSTAKVEEAMLKLKNKYTIILVTNNVKQSARVGDRVAFFLSGELVEIGGTERMFIKPKDKRTDDYISGRFG